MSEEQMRLKTIPEQAADLLVRVAVDGLSKAAFQGDALDGWSRFGEPSRNGAQLVKQMEAYIERMQAAIKHFHQCVDHEIAVRKKA